MKKVEDLVPKNKYDLNGIEALKTLSDEEILPVIPELLAWMRDLNWPVAKEMPALLVLHQKVIIPYIIEIFQPEQLECDWKTYIIWVLLPLLDEEHLPVLKPYLERIIENPTEGEIMEETNIAAEEFLTLMESKIFHNTKGRGKHYV